jgi:hypothetical protein
MEEFMALRHIVATTVTAGALVFVGQAGVAHATSQTVSQDCMSNVIIPVSLEVGETLTINTDPSGYCSNAGTFTGSGVAPQGVGVAKYGATGTENTLPYNSGTAAFPYGTRIIYTATTEGSIRIQMENDLTMTELTYFDITVTAASHSGGTDSTPSPAVGPSDVLQQVGMPTGGCIAVSDPALNWANVPPGGWGESWGQWANGGLGGSVCTRTLTYSTENAAWRVR